MEYVVFTIVVAASSVIIIWTWNRFMANERSNGIGSSRKLKGGVPDDPIPPFKRTISGPKQEDLERMEFDNRIESWQRKIYEQGSNSPAVTDRLAGTKYTYVPRLKRSAMQSDSAM